MAIFRFKYVAVVLLVIFVKIGENKELVKKYIIQEEGKSNLSSKIIEDVIKVANETAQNRIYSEDSERAKEFLNSIGNVSANRSHEDDQISAIIESIKRIKNNITAEKNLRDDDKNDINQAIILDIPKKDQNNKLHIESINLQSEKPQQYKNIFQDQLAKLKTQAMELIDFNSTVENIKKDYDKYTYQNNSDDNTTYVEIMTIEPNNSNKHNTTSHNIIEILKHLMPMFNSTLTKELHNITVIERDRSKNHSFSEVKNISTITVTYCDKHNLTNDNNTFDEETDVKIPKNYTLKQDVLEDISASIDNPDYDEIPETDLTNEEKKDIIEAADYGTKKMHELYSIMEPKLYSMGLWLDDTNPARYVAAFNAPAEEAARLSRYGYASLQAATRLKQLTSSSNNDGVEGRNEEPQFPSASALRQSSLMQHCPIRGTPKCPPASKRYRTHDGTCNNFNRPRWGSTMTPVQRFLTPTYSDGLQAPRRSVLGSKLPSAREISSLIHEDQNVESPSITHLLMQWGQFLDHDVTSSSQSRGFNGSVPRCCKDGGKDFVPREFMHPECMPISVPASDPFYGPKGVRCLDFVRSSPAPRDDCSLGWREQLNQVSAYIDASPLYGSSARKSDKLRLFRNGMLQYGRVQQRRPVLPPERRDELCRGGAVSTECFKSGDARVNEHPGLVAAHIVWLRQHNRMAQELAHLNPHWSDEKIYQETRKIVGAMVQHITYKEFLPIVLGSEVMRLFDLDPLKKGFYKSYNPKINPSPASSFSSAAFRFGHSLVQPSMVRFDRFHRPIDNNVSLHDELTNPSNIWSMGAVDRLLLGMVNQPIQKRDEFMTAELTNHLFQTPNFNFGMDLAAINIQRGRDHGVPAYTAFREPCGLTLITEFEDLFRVMPARTVRKFQTIYKHVDDIDLFTGGMAERPVVGGLVGPTFACVIAQQFSNLRKGDRFWYENAGFDSSFTPAQLQQIRRISFAQVLCRTLDNIDDIQPFVFLSSESPDNSRLSCFNAQLNNFDLTAWVEIDSSSNNDISKSDSSDIDISTNNTTKISTTAKPITTTVKHKPQKMTASSNKGSQKRPSPILPTSNSTKAQNSKRKTKPHTRPEKTDTVGNTTTTTKHKGTVQKIDDKLDFKNKSRRFDNVDKIEKRGSSNTKSGYDDYDDEDTQSVQSVVINNLSLRPSSYNRPISVTENIEKYTYLINYVPKPTQSWRRPERTTRRPYTDRDVVKVTYQTYDDTYRRPNKPFYYNRRDNPTDADRLDHSDSDRLDHSDGDRLEHFDSDKFDHSDSDSDRFDDSDSDKLDHPDYDILEHSDFDRHDPSNSERRHHSDSDNHKNKDSRRNQPTKFTTGTEDHHSSARSNDETDIIKDKTATTDNLHKLVTFGYVGSYKGDMTDKPTNDDLTDSKHNDDLSRDFSTYDNTDSSMKLSTFFHYETATKPYNPLQRSTRRDYDEQIPNSDGTKSKYYYIRNVLHKYPDTDTTMTDTPLLNDDERDIIKENYNNPGWPAYMGVQERTSADKLGLLDEIETSKTAELRPKKPASNSAKTPSVAFQVMPSENSPSQWAVYEENKDLPEDPFHKMPTAQSDPYALKEMPRPMDLSRMRKRPRGSL